MVLTATSRPGKHNFIMLKKYKCSNCKTTGEAISNRQFLCPLCGSEMLQIATEQELKTGQEKTNDLPVAKVVSLGFFDILPLPSGSKLDIFRQKLQIVKGTNTIQIKDSSSVLRQFGEIIHNPINDDILGNYKKQKIEQIKFYSFLGIIFFALLLILFLCI